jgi:hypothetical protein
VHPRAHVCPFFFTFADIANEQIKSFLTSGLLSFDTQAFRVTREEEMLMGIFDPSVFPVLSRTKLTGAIPGVRMKLIGAPVRLS